MPYRQTSITVQIVAWDTANNVGKTGDGANITVRGVGDGVEFTPTAPNITEVDSTNLKGVYNVSLTSNENNYAVVTMGGKSVTAGIVIIPFRWSNEVNADIRKYLGTAARSATQAGTPCVEVVRWGGNEIPTPVQAGVPKTDPTYWKGVAAPDIATEADIAAEVLTEMKGSAAAVAADGGNSATVFKTTLTESANDYWKHCLCKLTSGAMSKQVKRVISYNGTTKVITVEGGFTGTPADGVTFDLIDQ